MKLSALRVIVFAVIASVTPVSFLACATGDKNADELSAEEGTPSVDEEAAKKKHGKKDKANKKKDKKVKKDKK